MKCNIRVTAWHKVRIIKTNDPDTKNDFLKRLTPGVFIAAVGSLSSEGESVSSGLVTLIKLGAPPKEATCLATIIKYKQEGPENTCKRITKQAFYQ